MNKDEILENNVINTLRFSTKLTGNKELEKERLAIERLISLYSKRKDELDKKDKVIQETIKYLETYPYVAYTLNGDILHNSENAIKILKGEEIDEHLEGDIW